MGVHTTPTGDLIASGWFTSAGGVSANYVARWNGSTWSAIGSGMSGIVNSQLWVNDCFTLPNGDLIAHGNFAAAGSQAANRVAR